MKAIIMAGGMGTRLAGISGGLPKPMMPILGKPVMERIIALLREYGYTEVCAALRYRPEAVRDYFGDGSSFGVRLEYRVESQPLGTAGGVKNCADFYGDEDFLVISGDAACDFDLAALRREHIERRPAVTMALYPHAEPLSYGLVLTGPDGAVRRFIEKPDWGRVVTDLVNTGVYVVSPRAMASVPDSTPFDFARDLFPLLMERGETLLGAPVSGYWRDIGTPEAYYTCNLDALKGAYRLPDVPPDEPAKQPAPTENAVGSLFPCRSRARLMRALSESLMEAGADFSDGIRVGDGQRRASIRPSAAESALVIEGPGAGHCAELAARLEKLYN